MVLNTSLGRSLGKVLGSLVGSNVFMGSSVGSSVLGFSVGNLVGGSTGNDVGESVGSGGEIRMGAGVGDMTCMGVGGFFLEIFFELFFVPGGGGEPFLPDFTRRCCCGGAGIAGRRVSRAPVIVPNKPASTSPIADKAGGIACVLLVAAAAGAAFIVIVGPWPRLGWLRSTGVLDVAATFGSESRWCAFT